MSIKTEFLLINYLKQYSDNPAIIWYNESSREIYTYKEVLFASEEIIKVLKNDITSQNSTVGILIGHSSVIVSIILGIINSSLTFSCLDQNQDENFLIDSIERMQISYLFVEGNMKFKTKKVTEIYRFIILGKNITFLKYNSEKIPKNEDFPTQICYKIQTSGSTGLPKIVHVPIQCILPNIYKLKDLFQISSSDKMYVNSPPTFDPFIVDLFLALSTGASLIMTGNILRLSQEKLLEKIFYDKETGATFTQMTPALFLRFGDENNQNKILNEESTLKTLVLGGDIFPEKLMDFDFNNKNIYNIYGITEISCWATVLKIEKNQKISLGSPIDDETLLEVRSKCGAAIHEGMGELFIGSKTRVCLIDDEASTSNEIVFRATGDLVTKTRNNLIFYSGRKNSLIKRMGVRTSLTNIEKIAKEFKGILETSCIFVENKLVLFYLSKNDTIEVSLRRFLNQILKKHEIPDELIKLDEFPLSCHGKISKIKLTEIFKTSRIVSENNLKNTFLEEIKKICGLLELNEEVITKSKRRKTYLNSSFTHLGGTSIKALNLVTILENKHGTLPELMGLLLNESKTIEDILEYLKMFENRNSNLFLPISSNKSFKIKIRSKIDLEKCVDSNPTMTKIDNKNIISIGSHSSLLVNFDCESNEEISRINLSDRIECQVSTFGMKFGIVGTYDGIVYCFDIFSGVIKWKFNCGGTIKARCLIDEEQGFVIVGSYSEEDNLVCLESLTGNKIWSTKLGTKGIFSSPIFLNKNYFLTCSLDGSFAQIETFTGTIKWQKKVNSPIFSTPAYLQREEEFLIAEVSGIIHCFDSNGNEKWNIQIAGNIFSSFELTGDFIFFGCHDRNIYCLNRITKSLEWKTELQSQIYSTPKFIQLEDENYLIACTTTGFINLLDLNGFLINSIKLNGEIFSSPVISKNEVFVGCRDNYFYSLNMK